MLSQLSCLGRLLGLGHRIVGGRSTGLIGQLVLPVWLLNPGLVWPVLGE